VNVKHNYLVNLRAVSVFGWKRQFLRIMSKGLRWSESDLLAHQQKKIQRAMPQKEWIPIVRDEKELLEKAVQAYVFEWIHNADNQLLIPELASIYAIPNGSHKTKTEQWLHKITGLQPGVPDLHIPIARKGFHSFYIEVKRWKVYEKEKNHGCSENQMIWIDRLRKLGNRVEVMWSVSGIIKSIRDYLK